MCMPSSGFSPKMQTGLRVPLMVTSSLNMTRLIRCAQPLNYLGTDPLLKYTPNRNDLLARERRRKYRPPREFCAFSFATTRDGPRREVLVFDLCSSVFICG